MEVLLGLAMLAFAIWIYFVPAIVAFRRRHRNRTAITVLNVCLGWTLLGWIGAIVWAYTSDVEAPLPPKRAASDFPGEAHPLTGLYGSSNLQDEAASPPAPTQLFGTRSTVQSPASSTPEMKKCPYCAEDVRFEAIKCKHCGSDLRSPTF